MEAAAIGFGSVVVISITMLDLAQFFKGTVKTSFLSSARGWSTGCRISSIYVIFPQTHFTLQLLLPAFLS